jgi:hypothetical protein
MLHHSATAMQYCPSSSAVARHFAARLSTLKPPISAPGEIVAPLLTVRHRVSLELVTAFPAGLGGAKNRVASPNVRPVRLVGRSVMAPRRTSRAHLHRP